MFVVALIVVVVVALIVVDVDIDLEVVVVVDVTAILSVNYTCRSHRVIHPSIYLSIHTAMHIFIPYINLIIVITYHHHHHLSSSPVIIIIIIIIIIYQVYTFSGGTLKVVQNRQYSTIKNQYELTFSATSVILASDDAGISKQQVTYD